MPPRSPFLAKAIRFVLIGTGATTIMSAVVGIMGAFQLVEAAEEQSLGITRNEIVGWYLVLFAVGALLVYLGLRRKK